MLRFLSYYNKHYSTLILTLSQFTILHRSLIHDGVEGESPGLIGNSEGIGWHVITPFQIEGGDRHGDVILVNRGWVHDKLQNPETRKEAQVSGTVEIEGIVRKTEQRQQFAAKRNPRGDKWPWR